MNAYTNMKKCPGCNGPIFKFVNISDDTFHVQCGHTSYIQGDVTVNKVTYKNIFTPSKKVPCGFKQIFTQSVMENISSLGYDHEEFDYESNTQRLHSNILLPGNDDDEYIQSDDDDDDDGEEGYAFDDEDEDENDDVNESEEDDEPLDD